ncbi:MAG: Histidine triad (HIT) family protein [Candidatus Woesebacteria bacterium GW2011_GWB1_39_12]|uniref:Histidine triad (HIT) family protein n=2 Tax=Candidatus Woeseibacteriota TaxID=1752722 RepID=A0A0G0M347_9BACT|nr:MAG: Histidine triad (HIT) family protein [Candidatus Woesebacteria bacterium GW2011_GWA1_39_12]KKR00776.1 MAG: Histidine triad (HIT) family protein [Candidatus Woesebacteria bacterium GW2011_GWB1_39_12]
MEDCVFCQIVQGKTDTKLEKETDNLVVFRDINPQAAIHLLIVPKKHIKDLGEVDDKVWKEIKDVAVLIARDRSAKGFRLIHNSGDAASIPHMQIHFLADITPERAA